MLIEHCCLGHINSSVAPVQQSTGRLNLSARLPVQKLGSGLAWHATCVSILSPRDFQHLRQWLLQFNGFGMFSYKHSAVTSQPKLAQVCIV